MSGLLRKEVRSILPTWIVAMVLATFPVWIVWPGPGSVMFQNLGFTVFAPFGLGVLLLSISPFGQELNWGTFPVLLSQPVPRRQVWMVKVWVVVAALGLAFVSFCISNHIRVDSALESMKHTVWRNAFDRPGEQTQYFVKLIADTRSAASRDTLLVGGLAVLTGFAGGLWTTLLFRQVTAAFWLTFLIPMGLTALAGNVLKNFSDEVGLAGLALILGAYSAAGFLWAKRFFLSVQDMQWTGGVVALPQWGGLAARRGSLMLPRKRKPIRALLRKEFQAQHVNVLLAGGLLVVHLGVIALRRWSAEYLATHQSTAMALEMVPLLWLVMPLLIGSVAVAEERKLGTFQSNLCLPANRRLQFLSKLAVATALGIALGGVVPLVVEKLAPHNGITGNATGLAFLGDSRPIELLQLVGSVGLTFLACYGSTLTRNALQAMGAGLLGAVVVCLVVFGAQHTGDSADFVLWTGRLIGLIGWPSMTLTMFVLAFRNYKKLQPDFRLWARNGAALLVALLCVTVVTTAVYHRVWEAWLPEEPPHRFTQEGFSLIEKRPVMPGPIRSNRITSGYLGITIQDLTPALASEFKLNESSGALVSYVEPNSPADKIGLKAGDLVLQFGGNSMPDSQQFSRAVARTKPESKVLMEIEREGSTRTLEVTIGHMPDMRQVVRHSRVACRLAASGSQMAVVLPDGRLWLQQRQARLIDQGLVGQGMVAWYESGRQRKGFIDGSNWKDIAITQGACFGIQADGTLWNISEASPKLVGQDHDWQTISAGGEDFCALKSDGTLWEWGWRPTPSGPKLTAPMQVGSDNDWTAVCVSWSRTAGVKSDGSVWRWRWRSRTPSLPEPWLTGPCSEPVSFVFSKPVVASVCADGTLWVGGALTNSVFARIIRPELMQRAGNEMVRWGDDSDWKEIRFVSWGKAVGIKRDRTLWLWDVNHVFRPTTAWVVMPTMPSRYADWMSVCQDDNAFLALARDGSLCLWGDPNDRGYNYWNGYPNPNNLLMPSRIKARKLVDLAR
jgi:hypothetical protein